MKYTLHTFETIDQLQHSFIEAGADPWAANFKAQDIVATLGDENILAWQYPRIINSYDFTVIVTDWTGKNTEI